MALLQTSELSMGLSLQLSSSLTTQSQVSEVLCSKGPLCLEHFTCYRLPVVGLCHVFLLLLALTKCSFSFFFFHGKVAFWCQYVKHQQNFGGTISWSQHEINQYRLNSEMCN